MKLKHVTDRVIVQVDVEGKNSHTFSDGTKISLQRRYNNFNQRYVQPINATVISAEDIPEGAEILIHHNSTHDTNRIFDYEPLSGEAIASDIKYFSIPIGECFAWKKDGQWNPLPEFDFALRIFRPYIGPITGIDPTLIRDCLYIYTGDYSGKVCMMLKAADYEIIFQGADGREKRLIRCRPNGNIKEQRDPEVTGIDENLTTDVLNGKLLVGLSISDAKPLKEFFNDSSGTQRIIA